MSARSCRRLCSEDHEVLISRPRFHPVVSFEAIIANLTHGLGQMIPPFPGGPIPWSSPFDSTTVIITTLTSSESTPQTTAPISVSQIPGAQQSSDSTGLDTGAKIGIGLGSAGIVILLVGMMLWWYFVRLSKSKEIEKQDKTLGKQEEATQEIRPECRAVHDSPRYELHADVEFTGDGQEHELPAGNEGTISTKGGQAHESVVSHDEGTTSLLDTAESHR